MTTFPDRMGSDGISGGMGDASGPGSSPSVEPQAGLDASHSIPIAWTCQRCGRRLRGRKHWIPGTTYLHWGSLQCGGRATAQGIEADTAETGTGSVHESPLPEGNAP